MLTGLRCKCGKRLKLPESSIGKTGSCPVCKSPLRLVAPSYADGASPCDARLEITAGPDHVGEVILVAGDGPIGIGRAPAKDLILAGSSVSRNHCRLVRIDGGWRIEDEKSTSGLFVNNERVGGADLHNDDRLRIGDYELSYVSWNPSGVAFIGPWPPPFAAESTDAPAQAEPSDPMPPSEDAGAAQVGVFASRDDGLDDDNLYQLSEGEIVDIPKPQPQQAATVQVPSGGPTCPSCGRSLAPSAKICVQCGINLKTGRAIVTSQDTGLDAIYTSAESLLWWVSWLVWFGIYPIASEAFGVRKPYYIRAVALLTICTSLWFLAYEWTDSPRMHRAKNYMLWSGNLEPNRNEILAYYTFTNYGDSEAFLAKYQQVLAERADEELKRQAQAREAAARKHGKTSGKQAHAAADADAKAEDDPDRNEDPTADASAENKPHLDQDPVIVAHKSLSPEQQYQGRYSPSQLLTAAFLHGGLMHLVGNLIFLLVIGSRINALVGNLSMIVLYPLLAVLASVIGMAAEPPSTPHPCLGASGAIMGLAGMYLVLMPVHKVHMAAWLRAVMVLKPFHYALSLFSVRGFWVVLFYIAFDVVDTILGTKDNVAHWVHLGGFISGASIGLLLLFTRAVNCRGGDIVSALLGKHAWGLIGKPDHTRKALLEYGW